MNPPRSAFTRRAAAAMVTALALLAVVAPAWSTPATTSSASTTQPVSAPAVSASLLASSAAIPTGGTFEYMAEVRLAKRASYLQTVLEVFRPSGQLLFKRTRVANGVKPGTQRYSFERGLTDVLSLDPGSYPVRLTVSANVGGSTVSTETTTTLRVYDKGGPRLRVALVAHVTGSPMAAPDGRFAIDPAAATGARNAVGIISRRVIADPDARVTLAVPPVLLAEWRRLSGGYTLSDGTVVRPDDPVPVAYNSTLADLRAAIDTTRLELVSLGYSDPNLTDLANHGLANDVGPQYDAGVSAVFQSLETTPSEGTVPDGGCVPANEVTVLTKKGVRYAVVDSDCVKVGKGHPDSGVYSVYKEKLRALVPDARSSAALSAGDTDGATLGAFERLMDGPKQPLIMALDIDGDSFTSTDTVGAALTALERLPWIQLANARALKPPSGAGKARLAAGRSTPGAPKGYWKTVSTSRTYADAYSAALGPGDAGVASATQQSLVAESSAWADPDNTWEGAARGLEYAEVSLKTTQPVLDAVSVKVESVTLSGSSGEIPITIVNDTDKTLNVVVTVTSTGGVRVGQTDQIPTVLPPQETYLEVPVNMPTGLSGKLIVEVRAGDLELARKSATVNASHLDRLATGGAVVVALLVMLVFIVRRTRAAEADSGDSEGRAGYTGTEDSDARPSSR